MVVPLALRRRPLVSFGPKPLLQVPGQTRLVSFPSNPLIRLPMFVYPPPYRPHTTYITKVVLRDFP